jgi:homoserine dehydrogenase
MAHIAIVFIGFGNVGQALARLLLSKRALLQARYALTFQVNGISTGRHGAAIDPRGLDLARALALIEGKGSLSELSMHSAPSATLDFIQACPADVLFENTPVNHHSGQPAISYLRAALQKGMHAITANKGPVVHGYRELSQLAAAQDRRFLFESAVMDGAPIFSLFRGPLPATELRGFHGILNSTTNLILGLMEQGQSFDEAVACAQRMGLAETDPSHDIDGWDAAIKVAALATVLMDADLTPQTVQRSGIRAISAEMIAAAGADGERWKLVCSAQRSDGKVVGEVSPRRVGPDSPLYAINSSSSYVEFELDVLPGLGIVESNPGPDTTAYGLLADLINAMRGG